MKFGIGDRKHLSGADLAVCVTQIAAALPLIYLLVASGWYALLGEKTAVSLLFDFGVSVIPRALALALSRLYRLTGSEVLFSLLLTALALVYGIAMKSLLRGAHGRTVRIVLAALIALDLIARLITPRFAAAFGLPVMIAAFLIRAACLALVILDLTAKEP